MAKEAMTTRGTLNPTASEDHSGPGSTELPTTRPSPGPKNREPTENSAFVMWFCLSLGVGEGSHFLDFYLNRRKQFDIKFTNDTLILVRYPRLAISGHSGFCRFNDSALAHAQSSKTTTSLAF